MSIIQSLTVSLFSIVLVFFVLSCLFSLVKWLSILLSGIAHKRTGTAGDKAAGGTDGNIVSAGELKLIDVDEKTAAMIMAIVSHESRIPLGELSFRSIRAVK